MRAAVDTPPGALGVLNAMEGVPDPTPTPAGPTAAFAAVADRCNCGYATTGVLPRKKTCMVCTTTVLEARHGGVPEFQFDAENRERSRFGRRLRRANKAQRTAIALLDTARWDELAEAAARGAMTAPRHDARRALKWGLGSARLCALARLDNSEIDDWAKKRLFTRS